ncbi:MAG: hypothetical protein NC483_06315 [Ruminococcus sp.]|nr:hypothetical protein [Ruminococcus sp.]
MKKGFALLETIIVITFLSVSLLLLYNTFINMLNNSKKNILYDDPAKIYQTYYLKEYLSLNNLDSLLDNNNIKEISCRDFSINSCNTLIKEFDISKIYVMKYDLKDIDTGSSSLNNYLKALSNKDDYAYRLVVEYNNVPNYSYASIGLNGGYYE